MKQKSSGCMRGKRLLWACTKWEMRWRRLGTAVQDACFHTSHTTKSNTIAVDIHRSKNETFVITSNFMTNTLRQLQEINAATICTGIKTQRCLLIICTTSFNISSVNVDSCDQLQLFCITVNPTHTVYQQ